MAKDVGADGIFLISHGTISGRHLARYIYPTLELVLRPFWMGVNFLDLDNAAALEEAVRVGADGLWVDNCGADTEDDLSKSLFSQVQSRAHAEGRAVPILFGGTAFKYQPFCAEPAVAAWRASRFVDVVTTSGEATGQPPTVGKIRAMREAIGDHPLAIASGISADNLGRYIKNVDAFLVATSISRSFDQLDPNKLKRLILTRNLLCK